MNTKLTKKNVLSAGFSLVEMLVVIAVIGIIAAIAIPNIGSINSSAQTNTAKRNAQNIASVKATGAADGVAWAGADKAGLITSVVGGANGTDGTRFSVDGLDAAAANAASVYLTDSLVYKPGGGETATSISSL